MLTAEGTFAGVGGVPIHWERSAPAAGAPRGVVLLAHGYAEHVGRYRDFIVHLAARGLAVAAVDHRGHGRSGGPRGHCRDFAEFVADPLVHRAASAGFVRAIRAAQAAATAEAPRLRVPLLILQGDADRLVRPSGATEIAARLSCPHELVLLPGFYHELLNEPEQERGRVLEALDRWFDRWLAE